MHSRAIGLDFPRLGVASAAAMLLVGGVASAATTETFVPTTIQYPGSSSTAARGINSRGIRFTFTLEGDRFTLAWDVNARGDIVGAVGENQANTVGLPVNARGFLRNRHGEYRILEVQGASNTQVIGINTRRDIVGQYTDATTGLTHGFVYRVETGQAAQ